MHSKACWERQKKAAQRGARTSPDKGPSESLEHLTIPKIEVTRYAENRDYWKAQIYADFVQKLQRNNPDNLLTKQIVDAAFQLATTPTTPTRTNLNFLGRDSAIARVRCNGVCVRGVCFTD
jgi:hypothetical protein